jgi:hypothetical protein
MDKLIFGLCSLTAGLCAWMLLRTYLRTRFRLLLWSGLCFVGLTANNLLLVVDRFVLTDMDLSIARLLLGLVAVLLLLSGLILESSS